MFTKKLLYFAPHLDSGKSGESAPKGSEVQKTPEQILDEDKKNFKAKVEQIKQTANQYLKDTNPAVQAAAKDSLNKISSLEQNPLLDKKTIESVLEQINQITTFVDTSKTVEEQKAKLITEREKSAKLKSEELTKANEDLLAKHPELKRHNNATILLKRLEAKYSESFKKSINVAVSQDLPSSPAAVKISFAEHMQNPSLITNASSELGSALTFDRSFDHDLESKMTEFNSEANSLAVEYLSKMPEESTKYVSTEVAAARKRLEASDVFNKTQLLADLAKLEEGTLGNLELTKHSGEENKRAMIMANFKDNLNQLVGKAFADDMDKNPNATKDILSKRLKIKPDEIAKMFEKQGVTLNKIDGLSSETNYQILSANTQIRSVDGSELSYLNKNQKIQILDEGVYVLNDAFKAGVAGPDTYRYYKVRLEPQGAVGLVEAKFVSYEPKVRVGTTTVEGKGDKAAS